MNEPNEREQAIFEAALELAPEQAFVTLYWQSDSQPREIIPTSQLYPPATNLISITNKP